MDDPRFAKFSSDPKFRSVPRRERKIKIDPRFKSMFNDKSFVDKVSVDKRGRPKNFATKENFEKFYDLESSSEDDSEEEVEQPTLKKKLPEKEKATKSKLTEKEKAIKIKLRSDEVDYSRGEGVLETDSSSDDSSTDSSDEDNAPDLVENKFEKWGELDHDAGRTDESTNRIAVCNMDWDRVGAKDIFIALTSFCPPGGTVSSVKVYISDFGKKRLEEEETLGPQELRENSARPKIDFDNLDDDGEIDSETMEKIRVYQVNKLKYYYAVAEFDSVETADKVYQECDGMEYELSASRFDLRFIPDDMPFEEEPKEVCHQLPDPSTYKPKFFTTTALKQGKVNLTWDEPDQDRIATLRKAFDSEDCDDDDIKAYLANSSESEGEDDRGNLMGCGDEDEEEEIHESEEAVVAKYKSLLNDLQKKVKKSEDDSKDMEFSWVPNDATDEQTNKKEMEAMTPWEQYLHKKKLKRKEKREKKKKSMESKNEDQDGQQLFSDDELPDGVDLDDPFFKDALGKDKVSSKKKKSKNIPENTSKSDDGLDLLCMESDDDKEHFDYKNIVKTEKKKKKKKLKKNAIAKEDNFQIDVTDKRFSAVFDKADYNVDPSNPNFKKTKAMQALIEEKQKRRHGGKESVFDEANRSKGEPSTKKLKVSTSSLENLVQSVKSKSKNVKKRSNKF